MADAHSGIGTIETWHDVTDVTSEIRDAPDRPGREFVFIASRSE